MPELTQVESSKTAGFVDRGYNYELKRKRLQDEEKEIAKLEAEARGETVEEESDGEGLEATEVQATGDTQQEEANIEVEAQEDDSDLSPEEKSFKKRYGDLRRHMQQKEKEWEDKFSTFEDRMRKESIVPPKSDEDIENWAKEYPDVAGIVETIAAKKAQEMFKKAEDRLSQLDEIQYEAERKTAESKIRESHPDFDRLRESDEFHSWAEAQPKWVRDALYENMDDPDSVVRVIDLYKIDNGETPQAKKAKTKAAAKTIGKGSRTKVDPTEAGSMIRESEVAKMSAKEFESREEEITKAMRTGKFVYDLSGSAR
tara:strand:- start:457 stop:1398 length:942 start_codon:yes stop_codon:yes gene_type:complete